jgi:Leucine-rich repeat (LRR) protein
MPDNPKYCVSCGATLNASAKFCTVCGAPTAAQPPQPPPVPVGGDAHIAPPTPTPTAPPASPAVDYITIKGERYSTSLTELDLSESSLTNADIEPLRHMTNLTKLYLYINEISDISPLAGLSNLTELYLYDNNISDIRPLAGLTNLTVLSLLSNPITDWSPVAHVADVNGRP